MDERTFFRTVAHRLGSDENRAEGITLAVLQELRDRLTPNEAADVAAQLPSPLKRMWYDRDQPGRMVRRIHYAEFVGRVRQQAGLPDDVESERAVRAVFRALQTLLGSPTGLEGEAWDIFSQLPKDLKPLWLAAAQAKGT